MKNLFKIILLILLLLTCNNSNKIDVEKSNAKEKQTLENLITRIVFFENNTSVPANFESHKYKQIEITNDSAFLIEYRYVKGEFKETKTLKSIKLNKKQKSIFFSLPEEYLQKDKYAIGNPNSLSESIFNATITLNNNQKIVWEMGYDKTSFPNEIQSFFKLYFDIKLELFKTD